MYMSPNILFSKASEPSNQVDQSPSSVLNSTIPDDLMRDHSSISSSGVDSKYGPSGCPLSRFILQEEIPEINDSDLEDSTFNSSRKESYDKRIIKTNDRLETE